MQCNAFDINARYKRISGFTRMFSINICFFIEAVTNEFDG